MSTGLQVRLNVQYGSHLKKRNVTIPESGFLTLIGPNASGKSHILRAFKAHFNQHKEALNGGIVRFLGSGRLSNLESYRILHHANQALKVSSKYTNFETAYPDESRYFVETLAVDYQTLKDRPDIQLKIRARLKEFFNRDIDLAWDSGGLSVNFVKEDSIGERYGIGREASGLIHLVGLLTAIYDDETGVLMIDEPELSLHPQYQSFLLEEMRRNSGIPSHDPKKKIIIIATHSDELIYLNTPEDLKSLGFCSGLENPVHQFLEFDKLEEKERLENLISRLSTEFKRAFFADHILLLEGPTDEKICHALDKKLDLFLTGRGVEMLPLLGKGDFIAAHTLLRLLKKDVYILADIDWLIDGPEWVDRLVNSFALSERLETRMNLRNHLNIVLNITFDPRSGLFHYFQNHPYYHRSFKPVIDELKTREYPQIESYFAIEKTLKRTQFAEDLIKRFLVALKRVIVCREIELSEKNSDKPTAFRRTREFIAELDRLESVGIFLIREGELESCYISKHMGSKTVQVNEEMIAIQKTDCEVVRKHYRSILRALDFFVVDDSSAELRLIYDELDTLANNIRRFYETDRIHEIRNLFYRARQEGIFLLNLEQIRERVLITIMSNILVLGKEAGSLEILRDDTANTISEKVERFVYQYRGGRCDTRQKQKLLE